ncbi:EsaB/YukD family protein [Spiractinospora alimapuensis]|uniref:EsaB/YukD family protein n=1 Tax=Spiractinospora alimapuensis TaxID=2820884 RepID=UPI001F2AC5CF|nr:EsaB/YukD family protein [Spiractinospora alimapuensis]QVQ53868.1 EsaB/YukD family protein [Spiractinospora alimapuensis]
MTGYCRVTVTGDQKWADLILPDGVPLSTLMPQVIRVCATDSAGTDPGGWNLATVRGDVLAADTSLADSGVLDGDVLMLRNLTAPERPSFVDDVRGAVEDRIDDNAWIWRPDTTFGFGLVLAVLAPLALTFGASLVRHSVLDLIVGSLGLVVALVAMWTAVRRSMDGVAHVCVIAACGWGALTSALTVIQLSVGLAIAPIVPVAFGAAGALAAAAAGWWINEVALPYLAALSVMTVCVGVLVVVGLFADGPLALRALALLLVLGVGGLPRMALVLGGLSGLDYEVRHQGHADTERFDETLLSSDRILMGSVVGVSATLLAAVGTLTFTGVGRADLLLAGFVSLLLVMRSRLFDRVPHVLVTRMAGVLGLTLVVVSASGASPLALALLPAASLAFGVLLASLSGVRLTDVPRASLRRLLNGVEVAVVVALCVTSVWALGLYDLVTTISIGGD